jgi:hypothetical protein
LITTGVAILFIIEQLEVHVAVPNRQHRELHVDIDAAPPAH